MTFASPRYAPIALVLLIAAGFAAPYLRQHPRKHDTCRDPEQLVDSSALAVDGYSVSVSEEARAHKRNPRLDGFLLPERRRDSRLPFTIRRTIQLTNWLVRPTSALPGPAEPVRFKTIALDIDGKTVPVQLAYGMHRGSQRFIAYTLAYEGEPITAPFWVRMREAPISLFTGVRPITYIGVAGTVGEVELPRHERSALAFIESGWRHYRKACGP